jgi:hypothetical protein
MTEREAFEKFVTTPPLEWSVERYDSDGQVWPGQYKQLEVALAWEAWLARAVEPQVYTRFGKAVWDYIVQRGELFCGEEISEDILPLAQSAGLCSRVKYDPVIHGDNIDAETGDEIWWWEYPVKIRGQLRGGFCRGCDTQNDQTANYCAKCGASLVSVEHEI